MLAYIKATHVAPPVKASKMSKRQACSGGARGTHHEAVMGAVLHVPRRTIWRRLARLITFPLAHAEVPPAAKARVGPNKAVLLQLRAAVPPLLWPRSRCCCPIATGQLRGAAWRRVTAIHGCEAEICRTHPLHDARRWQGCACGSSASGAQQGADWSGHRRLCRTPRGRARAAAAVAPTAGCAQQRGSAVEGQRRLRGRSLHDGEGRGKAFVTAAAAQWEHAAAGGTWHFCSLSI